MTAVGHIDEITYLSTNGTNDGEDARRVPKGAILCVRGWAAFVSSDRTVAGVYLSIDGGAPIETVFGEAREDVARALGDESVVDCGFRALFATGNLAPGDHGVTVSIRDTTGRHVVVDETGAFCIDDADHRRVLAGSVNGGPAVMQIDSLAVDGKSDVEPLRLSQTGVLEIGGWAIDETSHAAASAVFALVGPVVVKATYGFPRADVAAAHDADACTKSGFSLSVPMDTIAAGTHLVKIRVLGTDGETVYDGASIRIDVSSPIVAAIAPGAVLTRGSVDEAVVYDVEGAFKPSRVPLTLLRGERLLLRGWAVDERGDRVARAVHVCVDDLPATPAVYKIDRMDVARALGRPDLAGCGFLGIVSTIALEPGPHVASIRVMAGDGREFYELGQSIEFFVSGAG